MEKVYPSEKSLPLGIFLWASILIPTFYGFYENEILLFSIMILMDVFVGIIWFGTRYSIRSNFLIVFIGPLRISKIDIYEIKNIKKSNSILSSPANSFNRIEVNYNKYDSILISPLRRNEFLNDLKSINPKIDIFL